MSDMVKIGFTGTQKGMTTYQLDHVKLILGYHNIKSGYNLEVHHGDCIGADDEFNTLAGRFGCKRVAHPCNIDSKRAWGKNEECLPVQPPLVRNHHIVDAVDIIIATPGEQDEVLRSGTWATIRYCKKTGKKVYIIYP